MNVIIIDDDKFVTSALKAILEASGDVTVPATGTDGSEAIELYEKYNPDILLTDIQMKGLSGLEATEAIIKKYPGARILLLTTFLDDEYIIQALKLGAKGYLLKQDYESILPALEAVYSGQSVFGTEIISKIPGLISSTSKFDYTLYDINEREINIIELIADGLSNKEIAAKLFLSEGTVRNYLSQILEKLGLHNRTQLAVFYYKHN
ncbi:MAG: response regulator transcription factor [Lachnospiraceae bacterium]|jgi:Response regulator containing a CheY-like receiver domain and an HTH DNA-binding domain|nr:response regulator transcription factor [Lachnospiraceae bacterium]